MNHDIPRVCRRTSNPGLAAALLATALVLSSQALALTPEERGLEIATAVDRQNDDFGDSTADMTMTLINRAGKESVRRIRSRTLEVDGDGDKSMSIFDEPADVKGTASLTFSHATEADEQWLYLPALKRVKRISSRNKSGPFMGSEFAFEDISSQEVDKYTYRWLEDTTLDGIAVHRIEQRPAYEYSGYTRMINWVDQERLVPVKVEYFDRKDAPLKTLVFSDYQQYLDRYWRAHRMEMDNLQTGKRTILTFDNYQFQTGLSDRDFSSNALKRLR